jgi:hydroxyethylthiazole kinase-like uncharacterized protein yjeF
LTQNIFRKIFLQLFYGFNKFVKHKVVLLIMKTLKQHHINAILNPRKAYSHKGNYGHALLIAGSLGKMGAAIIAARACMRAGVGLLTINIPKDERINLQTTIPEAMTALRENEGKDFDKFTAVGIGSGIGLGKKPVEILSKLLLTCKKPLVLDADALNIIAANKKMLNDIPPQTIITPHAKEFDRLFGTHNNTEERIQTAIEKAEKYKIAIILKGHNTIITFNEESFKNNTGNAGLAKAGSGDALTGIITSFLAQGYTPIDAAKMSVYMHGLAADICLKKQSMESMLITDVIECFGKAFKEVLKA